MTANVSHETQRQGCDRWAFDRGELYCGDALSVLSSVPSSLYDSVITDAPYGLQFMGSAWDYAVPDVRYWREALRVTKPGGALLAFGGTRTHHRLMCAIEDAGWELRDVIMWVYGSRFPKSHDISKAIDKAAGAERTKTKWKDRYHDGGTRQELGDEHHRHAVQLAPTANGNLVTLPATDAAQLWDGWGTALKPAWEPIIVAMKPLDGTFAQNALAWGVAGLWIDGGRVGTENRRMCGATDKSGETSYILGARQETHTSAGRWPANLIHDGSDEVLAGFPETGSGNGPSIARHNENQGTVAKGKQYDHETLNYGDIGSAARFFYCAKAARSERNLGCSDLYWRRERPESRLISHEEWKVLPAGQTGRGNIHPTVKPLALMRHLARLTKTPTGGHVLDLFCGSGSTGCAALLEGRWFTGIDVSRMAFEIARARLDHVIKHRGDFS